MLSIGPKLFTRWAGRLRFLAFHPVTDHISAEIIAGLPAGFEPDLRATVYVGIHRPYKGVILPYGMRIGIQTEQFFDEGGNELWNYRNSGEFVRLNLSRFNRVLDLNATNERFYSQLGKAERSRLTLGPRIFPSIAPHYQDGSDNCTIFFGRINPRRGELIKLYNSMYNVKILDKETYGSALYSKIDQCGSILNLHYADGVYTEYPRLLTALTCGKTVISEQLNSDLIVGKEYLLAGSPAGPAVRKSAYEAFARKMTREYSFAGYVAEV
jgi:hypothetical protein